VQQSTPADQVKSDLWARAVVAVPSRLPVVAFWLTLVVSCAVLIEQFRPWVVLGGTALAVGITWRGAPDALPVDRATIKGSALAVLGATAWVILNLPFVGQVLLVQRDPGFLTLAGIWLKDHADPDIPLRSVADLTAQVPWASPTSDAFWRAGDHLYAQGAKAFPGLLVNPEFWRRTW
jgi:hypothetical protein